MPNLIYLMEREVGFSVDGIGFPSIQGCHAIVYQVADGIFGFHNAGNSHKDNFDVRAKRWADWVLAHPKGKNGGVALYGVTFARCNERGYADPPLGHWKSELKTFANRLNFKGPLIGHDLTNSFTAPGRKPSVYVEYLHEGSGYSIFVREWYNDARDGKQKSDYVASADFKNLDYEGPKMVNGKLYEGPKVMVTGVDRSGLVRVFPERLGGL